ncbi:hypothetical protein BDZ94DRAFT_1271599 [Collybia nuda]|uniref:NmrA-like domain-containing protein n=1 Tax=Collybia nuda TaxID=64659 RepID=A0A9P6CEL0_9AGAR|nr:hypothetical protein BDZ94DRAFT_1271599 [Collybia nuda]
MTVLIIGGTGKTGLQLAHLLTKARYPVLLTSRSGDVPEPYRGVKFDWLDSTTFGNPFEVEGIDRVYLVGPPVLDALPPAKKFIDLAVLKGVKRFVLLSATLFDRGGPVLGKVHEYLVELGVDYCVLRPTWFMDNFGSVYRTEIRDEGTIVTTAKDGRIPFIAADDISKAAFRALIDEKSHNTDHLLVGPGLYSYDEAATLLGEVLGRGVTHKRISDEDGKKFWMSLGMEEDYAAAMVWMESFAAAGDEEVHYHAPLKQVGRKSLLEYFQENRDVWAT